MLLGTGGHAADAPTVLIFGDSLSAGYGIDVDQSWATLLQARLKDKGYPFRERQVPSMDLFQVFVEDPNGITVELNYWAEDQKAA